MMMDERTPVRAPRSEAGRRRAERERRMRARRVRALVVAACLVVILGSGVMVAVAVTGARRPIAPVAVKPSSATAPVSTLVVSLRATADADRRADAARRARASTSGTEGVAPLVPAPGVKTILVDKSSQTVTLYDKAGLAVDRFPCASGHLYPRIGTYKVTSRKAASQSTYDSSRFYHFVIFTVSDKGTNIGFHSIPIDTSGKEVGGLGQPVSHGCVRLAHEKAEFVYEWAPNGTKVVVRD